MDDKSEESDERFDLISTEEILEELSRRFDNIVFAGVGNMDEASDKVNIAYDGTYSICVGLASKLAHVVNVDWEGSRKETLE